MSISQELEVKHATLLSNVKKYLPHLNCVSTMWPKHARALLLQNVLVERAQDAYSALSIEESENYETTVLRTYKLVPEAHRA